MAHRSLVVAVREWEALSKHFAGCDDESMAFGFCGGIDLENSGQYLLREVDFPAEYEYRRRGRAFVSLKAEFTVSRALRARGCRAFLDAHSHPFARFPQPSHTDDEGSRRQARLLNQLAPEVRLLRIVFSGSGHVWAEESATDLLEWSPVSEIVILGIDGRRVLVPVNSSSRNDAITTPRDARTALVIGDKSVMTLRNLRVVVIGLGGVGSAVARLIAGYVDHLDLVDSDEIEAHNAPRLHFYAAGDDGQLKVEVVKREIVRAFPSNHVEAIQERFPGRMSIDCFRRADFVFCCPDHNSARYAVAREAARFMKPVIEVGCGGRRKDGKITALGYHVRLQTPDGTCLACNGLDLRQLEDPSTTEMKRRTGYLNDDGVVPGELTPLTTRAAADAVELFFRYITGYAASVPRNLYFDALHFRMLDATEAYQSQPDCMLCGSVAENLRGTGDGLSEDQQILASPGGDYAVV